MTRHATALALALLSVSASACSLLPVSVPGGVAPRAPVSLPRTSSRAPDGPAPDRAASPPPASAPSPPPASAPSPPPASAPSPPSAPAPTDEARAWTRVLETRASAASRAPVTSDSSAATAARLVGDHVARLLDYQRSHCQVARAAHCDEADAALRPAGQALVAVFDDALAIPTIRLLAVFDELQRRVMPLEPHQATTGIDLDALVRTLGERTRARRASQLATHGGSLRAQSEATGQPVCATYTARPKGSDTKALGYVFAATDTIWIKCVFTRPPATFRRDDGDYWSVRIRSGQDWEKINLFYDLKKPSTSETVVFELRAAWVLEAVEANVAAHQRGEPGALPDPGRWLDVAIFYVTPSITGRTWSNGAAVDTWNHQVMAGDSIYLERR